jgi:mannose/fructose/N-acetylgalactosamine-specific phosphotransferase system component IIB
MGILLYRIDERLIHGQVVVGWGSRLQPDRIVVVDDLIARSDWEQELYSIGLPEDVVTEFVDIEQARRRLPAWQNGGEGVFVLTRDVATMLELARGGTMAGADVNLGGLHHAPGRREVLPYVFLSTGEAAALHELAAADVTVTARDLPAARPVPLARLLAGGARS